MLKTIALAGIAAALVAGSVAVAQTTYNAQGQPNQSQNQNQNANPNPNANANPNGAMNDQGTSGSATAPNAAQNGSNASATAGERG